jgi:hypothetical protein
MTEVTGDVYAMTEVTIESRIYKYILGMYNCSKQTIHDAYMTGKTLGFIQNITEEEFEKPSLHLCASIDEQLTQLDNFDYNRLSTSTDVHDTESIQYWTENARYNNDLPIVLMYRSSDPAKLLSYICDKHFVLLDGAHRLTAMKLAGEYMRCVFVYL